MSDQEDIELPNEIQTLGEAVRYLRRKRGLTLHSLAHRVGVSAPFLSDVEHSRRKPRSLEPLARALEVDVAVLKALDGRIPQDVKDWLEKNPQVVDTLRKLRGSAPDGGQELKLKLLQADLDSLRSEFTSWREEMAFSLDVENLAREVDEVLEMLRAAFVKRGLLLPVTEEQVAEAEKRMEENPVELSESLKDPQELFDKIVAENERATDEAIERKFLEPPMHLPGQAVKQVQKKSSFMETARTFLKFYEGISKLGLDKDISDNTAAGALAELLSNEFLRGAAEAKKGVEEQVDADALADLAIEGAKAAERKIRQRVAQELFEVFRQTGTDTDHGQLEVLRHAVGQLQQGKKATGAI